MAGCGDRAQETGRAGCADTDAECTQPPHGAILGRAGFGSRREPCQGELARGDANPALDLAPDRECVLELRSPRCWLVAREHVELERFREAVAIVPLASLTDRSCSCCGGLVPVAGGERKPAKRVQRHSPVVPGQGCGALGEGFRAHRLVVDEDSREAAERRDDEVGVEVLLDPRERILVGHARENEIAPLAVDIAETREADSRLGATALQGQLDHARVIGRRLVEETESELCDRADCQRPLEEPQPRGGRDPKRLLQLDEGRAIEAAVRETACAVRPDATEQGSIAGTLRRAEGDLEIAVRICVSTLSSGDHGRGCVRCRERPVVAGALRGLQRAPGERCRLLHVGHQPPRAGRPGEQQRAVGGVARIRLRPRVALDRARQIAPVVMGHPQPPGQRGVQRARRRRGPLEGRDRALVVRPLEQGIADQPLDRGRSEVGWQAFGEPENRVGMARADELRPAFLQQAGNVGVSRHRRERREGRVDLALRLEPFGGADEDRPSLLLRQRPRRVRELADERVQRERVSQPADEQPSLDELVDDLVRACDAELRAELRREAVEGRDRADERLHVGGLPFEDLVREEREERAARTLDEVAECPLALGVGHLADGFDREPDGRRPAARRFEDDAAEPGVRTEAGIHELLDLSGGECKVGGAQVEHLALGTQPVDAKIERLPREQHESQARRALPAQALDQPKRGGGRRQLVGVVDDQQEVVVEGGLERVAQSGRERLGVRELVLDRGRRRHELRQVGHHGPNRLGDTYGERRQAAVVRGRRVPRRDDVLRPARDERRLPVAGSGDDERQALPERVVEAPLEERSSQNE